MDDQAGRQWLKARRERERTIEFVLKVVREVAYDEGFRIGWDGGLQMTCKRRALSEVVQIVQSVLKQPISTFTELDAMKESELQGLFDILKSKYHEELIKTSSNKDNLQNY